jgi:hypothetical protein
VARFRRTGARETLPFGATGTRDLLDKLQLKPAVVDLPDLASSTMQCSLRWELAARV